MDMNNVLRYRIDEERCSEVLSLAECSDMLSCSMADVQPSAQGRMIEINVRVRRVCPGKRTALGVMLHELDENNVEHARGMKTMTLPAHHEQSSRDIVVEGVKFVLPEDLSLAEGSGNCGERRFRVRTHVHYVDFGDGCGE